MPRAFKELRCSTATGIIRLVCCDSWRRTSLARRRAIIIIQAQRGNTKTSDSLQHPLVGVDVERGDEEVCAGGRFEADHGYVGTPSVLVLGDGGPTRGNGLPQLVEVEFVGRTEATSRGAAEHSRPTEAPIGHRRCGWFTVGRVRRRLFVFSVVDTNAAGAAETQQHTRPLLWTNERLPDSTLHNISPSSASTGSETAKTYQEKCETFFSIWAGSPSIAFGAVDGSLGVGYHSDLASAASNEVAKPRQPVTKLTVYVSSLVKCIEKWQCFLNKKIQEPLSFLI